MSFLKETQMNDMLSFTKGTSEKQFDYNVWMNQNIDFIVPNDLQPCIFILALTHQETYLWTHW